MCQHTCNTCEKCEEDCTCSLIQLDNCVGDNCEEKLDAACVIYKWNKPMYSNLQAFLGLNGNVSIERILELLDSRLADLELGNGVGGGKVRVNISDENADFLINKIVSDDFTITVTDDYKLKISVDKNALLEDLLDESVLLAQTSSCPDGLCAGCTPEPTTPIITSNVVSVTSNELAVLSSTNCNGTNLWFNTSGYIGQGNTLQVGPGNYYAKCQTTCGLGSASNNLAVILNTNLYTATRTLQFTKNNCTLNQCGEPCVGSSVSFTKTYTSTISLETAQLLAANDGNFISEGQAYANTNGVCTCAQTVLPTYTTVVLNNPSCAAGVPLNNGSIQINGLLNANRIAFGTTGFNSLSWDNSNTISTNFYNITDKSGGTYYIKIFYAPQCFVELVRTLTTPNCQSIQIDVIQPQCTNNPATVYDDTVAQISMSNLQGIFSYRWCSGSTFVCSDTCNPGDSPLISNNEVTFTIPAPTTVSSQTYTIKLYTDNTCQNFVTRQIDILKPNCCNVQISGVSASC